MRAGKHFLPILFAVLSCASFSSHADNFVDKRQFASSISLDQAVEMAQSQSRAKAVKAETVNDGGRRVHQIRLLSPDGKVSDRASRCAIRKHVLATPRHQRCGYW